MLTSTLHRLHEDLECIVMLHHSSIYAIIDSWRKASMAKSGCSPQHRARSSRLDYCGLDTRINEILLWSLPGAFRKYERLIQNKK